MTNRPARAQELSDRLSQYNRDDLIGQLREHAVPCAQVRTVAEALEEPHLKAREMVVDISQAQLGKIRTLGNPIKLSAAPALIQKPPPALGEHNDEILKELGLDESQETEN
jgi:crotonobetainyl-CoA:carnitine CoA-transferase CaiB-like acyl-CoA transferase